ncbi:MAG: BON domain-containing protein [Victivallales bacterium]|nr:BON domain-containing protein [Victivallales bacterium]
MKKANAIVPISLKIAILMVMQMSAITPAYISATKERISDSSISSAIEDELMYEKGIAPLEVDVSTRQGIVMLSGPVDNLLTKERAIRITGSIRGVRGIIDRIDVTPVSRPDADIRKDILTALLRDPATESYQVDVAVKEATAVLSGHVGSYYEKQLAARIAEGVKGIKKIQNDIAINYTGNRTDAEIEADIKSHLRWDIWIKGERINASVKVGNVTLSGIVGSAIGKARVVDDAWLNGVLSVNDSGLQIAPWTHNDARRKSKYIVRPDSGIKQALATALRLDPRVAAFSPAIAVKDGVVRLKGVVGNLKAKSAAQQDAENMTGVWEVENRLTVKPGLQPADTEIKSQLKAAFLWDPLLQDSTINVVVVNGVAFLSGMVGTNLQKKEAQDIASRTKGVLIVNNHLRVEPEYAPNYFYWPYYGPYEAAPYDVTPVFGPSFYLTDDQVKKNIEKKLFWSPFVDKDQIKVDVNAGVATLTGNVGTWIGWGEADKDARKSGAIAVINKIKVE